MNPVTLSNPTLFHESSFSKPADLEERISLTAENSLHFMKLEPSEADLSDLLLREWELEFQQILDRGEKIIATLEKESNFKNQEDASNLPLSQNSAFSEVPLVAFKSFPDNEGQLPSQKAFLELEPSAKRCSEENGTGLFELSLNGWDFKVLEMEEDDEIGSIGSFSQAQTLDDHSSEISPSSFDFLPTSEGLPTCQNAFLELEQGTEKSREEKTDCIDLKKASWADYCKTYRAANKEKLKTYRTLYYQKNKDRKKAYRNANKERIRAYQVAYRQRQKKLKSDISLSDIQKHAPYTKA